MRQRLSRLAARLIAIVRSPAARLKRRLQRRIFSVHPVSHFAERHKLRTWTLHPASVASVAGPKFVNAPRALGGLPESVSVTCPAVQAVEFVNARVMGTSDMVFVGADAVHADVMRPERDMSMAEVLKIAAFVPRSRKLHIQPPSLSVGKLRAGVTLLGECTGNYAHWMFETLPKIVALDAIDEYADLPLLVDAWIHPVFFASLRLLNSNYRDIHRVDRWSWREVERLVYVTPPSYTAPENRKFIEAGVRPDANGADFLFSKHAIEAMRTKAAREARKFVGHGSGGRMPNVFRIDSGAEVTAALHDPWLAKDPDVKTVKPTRIYLKRTSVSSGNPRQLIDEHRIESILADYGFVSIDPAILSFPEQVLLLEHAEVVVSVVGAALANLVFAPPGVKVLALAPYYQGANYYYFSNMMGVLGHELTFVVGPQVDQPERHIQHRDYQVDIEAMRNGLDRIFADLHADRIKSTIVPQQPSRPAAPRAVT